LLADREDPIRGIEKAAQRIEELKELTRVWKGTAEEKGRTKFIEGLARMVEDRHKDLLKEVELAAKREGRNGDARQTRAIQDGEGTPAGGYGLIGQLQRLRGGL
jgi:hypothetical protein